MSKAIGISFSRVAALSASMLAIVAGAGAAQGQVFTQSAVPLSDVCAPAPGSFCVTPIIGTRTVVPFPVSATAIPGGTRIRGGHAGCLRWPASG